MSADTSDAVLWLVTTSCSMRPSKRAPSVTLPRRGQAKALLIETHNALLVLKPAYQCIVTWADTALSSAPEGRVGAILLPGGAEWDTVALKLNTTLDLTAEDNP